MTTIYEYMFKLFGDKSSIHIRFKTPGGKYPEVHLGWIKKEDVLEEGFMLRGDQELVFYNYFAVYELRVNTYDDK